MRDTINDGHLSDELLKKRCIDMTGKDIYIIITEVIKNMPKPSSHNEPIYLRGEKELADYLKCSISTISRWLKTNVIHGEAVIRQGKFIMFEANKVLEQLRENKDLRYQPDNYK